MKYFVVSDVHSFYNEMITSLNVAGFDIKNDDHKLILCGDAFDRGPDAVKMLKFLKKLSKMKKLIYIRGNHEDLLIDCLDKEMFDYYDVTNGTLDTIRQFAEHQKGYSISDKQLAYNYKEIKEYAKATGIVDFIIKNTVNYFETDHYVFVHGFIPTTSEYTVDNTPNSMPFLKISYDPNWRNAKEFLWKNDSRWANGMELNLFYNIKEPNKTIVIGHFHASYGNVRKNADTSKMDERLNKKFKLKEFNSGNEVFKPYYGNGIIAIDACTAYTGFVNCVVLED